jgi:hypothetical protein
MPLPTATLLDLVCKFSGRRKRWLINEIMAQGLYTVLGVTHEDIVNGTLTVPEALRADTERGLKELAAVLLGESE